MNANLKKAKDTRNDEFYTMYKDIEKELQYYTDHFSGKTVYCNSDNPLTSNFYLYFALNFERLGLKRLIVSSYTKEGIGTFTVLDEGCNTIQEVRKLTKVKLLKGDGDFRSPESIELLKQSDIVVTNPPFSLFREYIDQLTEFDKKFLLIGNINAVLYRNTLKHILVNNIWLGHNKSMMEFTVPTPTKQSYLTVDGIYKQSFGNIRWFTNLVISKRKHQLEPTRSFKENPHLYRKYDNYDAIHIKRMKDIPKDYIGVMGVPVTFLDTHDPNKYELIGITDGREHPLIQPTKRYTDPIQHFKDGRTLRKGNINSGATLTLDSVPEGIYHTATNCDYPLKVVYTRLLVRKI